MGKDRIIEGKLRTEELAKYLQNTQSPNMVFLSEDATGVVTKVVFDSNSNQLIGIVPPFDENGMPELFSFKADSSEQIKHHLKQPKSTLVYVVVAQPLKRKTPPFILQIFGSNNKFKTIDVLKRWRYTVRELKK